MDCVVVAGGRPEPEDPLYPYTQGKPKALLTLASQPMLAYVLRALSDARQVDRLVVVGVEKKEGQIAAQHLPHPEHVVFLPDQGGIIRNSRFGVEWVVEKRPEAAEVLLSTGDIPLLTGAAVDAFVQRCRPFDHLAYYNLVTRETMETRFPNSNRTFVRLKGVQVAGGDLILVQTRVLDSNRQLWEALTNARKHAWQLARIVGPLTLLKLILRRLSVSEVEEIASRMFEAPVRILLSAYPELAMDVDKPHQVELIKQELTNESVSQRVSESVTQSASKRFSEGNLSENVF